MNDENGPLNLQGTANGMGTKISLGGGHSFPISADLVGELLREKAPTSGEMIQEKGEVFFRKLRALACNIILTELSWVSELDAARLTSGETIVLSWIDEKKYSDKGVHLLRSSDIEWIQNELKKEGYLLTFNEGITKNDDGSIRKRFPNWFMNIALVPQNNTPEDNIEAPSTTEVRALTIRERIKRFFPR